MSIKAVLFDKDGVLVDFDATWCPSALKVIDTLADGDDGRRHALADAAGFDLAAVRFRKDSVFIAGESRELVDLWAEVIPEMPKYALGKQSRALFTKFGAEHVAAYDDVADTLAALGQARIAMGIATNDDEISARTQMRALRLDGRFSFVAGADSGHGAKPGPGMLLAFAKHINVPPSEIIMVGDSTHDLSAARAAGMIGVGVATGPASFDDLQPHADHCIDTLGDLVQIIERR
jgi:phosphoglycolate phosphatase